MKKPIKPVEPDVSDTKKYPRELNNAMMRDSPFVRDYKQYQKDLIQHEIEFELWQQTKFIEDVKRSGLRLCLKKYKITKR